MIYNNPVKLMIVVSQFYRYGNWDINGLKYFAQGHTADKGSLLFKTVLDILGNAIKTRRGRTRYNYWNGKVKHHL